MVDKKENESRFLEALKLTEWANNLYERRLHLRGNAGRILVTFDQWVVAVEQGRWGPVKER